MLKDTIAENELLKYELFEYKRQEAEKIEKHPDIKPGDLTISTLDEQSIIQELKEIEEQLKTTTPYDIKVNSREIENIVYRTLKDLTVIQEESYELQHLLKTLDDGLRQIDAKLDSLHRLAKSGNNGINKEERITVNQAIEDHEEKRVAKTTILRKQMDVSAKNENQKNTLTSFLVNLYKELSRRELEQKVRLFCDNQKLA